MNSTSGDEQVETLDIDPAEYAEFIRQIELTRIWLQSARISNHAGPVPPDQATIKTEDTASWDELAEGFRAYHEYVVSVDSPEQTHAVIRVKFALDFTSEQAMNDELFTIFQAVNLPFNSWPYLREFVASSLARIGWEPFTLPAIKRGV